MRTRSTGSIKRPKMKTHTPYWDRKVQREFEAKNPGPPKRKSRTKKVVITISDDEPDEQLHRMGDDWTMAIWDELVKDKPEHWDMHDALRFGKKQGDDPSHRKRDRPETVGPHGDDERSLRDAGKQDATAKTFIDVREWEGKDLGKAVEEGR